MPSTATRTIRRATILGVAYSLVVSATPAIAEQLYAGETPTTLAGFPAVTYFQAGDPDKPLIVFNPGAHHAARISYGGHEGGKSEDFLAHWLEEKGYNFLAISYPIDTASGMMEGVTPEFGARDWGQQISEATLKAIDDHDLTGDVYFAHWSMAGKSIQPAHAAMADAGRPIAASFSFAATPGIPGIVTLTQELQKTEEGYANRETTYPGWIAQIEANSGEGRDIIPEDVFKSEYLGHIPVNLQGYGEIVENGETRIDHMQQAQDYGSLEFANHPWVIVFQVDDRADGRHAINDTSYWSYYNTHTLFAEVGKRDMTLADLSEASWERMVELSKEAPERLRVDVGGNHFFFVGEEGARSTANAIDQAITQLDEWNADIDDMFTR